MSACLQKELPELIYKASESRLGPESCQPILNWEMAFKNNEFMLFVDTFDESVDLYKYRDGYLSNDVNYLCTEISDSDIVSYEAAIAGRLELPQNERGVLVEKTHRFHFVQRLPATNLLPERYTCDCYRFYKHRWCYNSAYMQHRAKLKKEGEKIPGNQKQKKRIDEKTLDRRALRQAELRVRERTDTASCNLNPRNQDDTSGDGSSVPHLLTQE